MASLTKIVALLIGLVLLAGSVQEAESGLISYELCQGACLVAVITCFACTGPGYKYGTVPRSRINQIPGLAACVAVYSACSGGCAVSYVTPW